MAFFLCGDQSVCTPSPHISLFLLVWRTPLMCSPHPVLLFLCLSTPVGHLKQQVAAIQ
jgi:hypothetical protein